MGAICPLAAVTLNISQKRIDVILSFRAENNRKITYLDEAVTFTENRDMAGRKRVLGP